MPFGILDAQGIGHGFEYRFQHCLVMRGFGFHVLAFGHIQRQTEVSLHPSILRKIGNESQLHVAGFTLLNGKPLLGADGISQQYRFEVRFEEGIGFLSQYIEQGMANDLGAGPAVPLLHIMVDVPVGLIGIDIHDGHWEVIGDDLEHPPVVLQLPFGIPGLRDIQAQRDDPGDGPLLVPKGRADQMQRADFSRVVGAVLLEGDNLLLAAENEAVGLFRIAFIPIAPE